VTGWLATAYSELAFGAVCLRTALRRFFRAYMLQRTMQAAWLAQAPFAGAPDWRSARCFDATV
jgi:hypothetical protein